jgi:hypothetical protein
MVTYAFTAPCAGGVTVGVGRPDEELDPLEDELGDELLIDVLTGSLGDGENDCVCVPLLPPHAVNIVARATVAAAPPSR